MSHKAPKYCSHYYEFPQPQPSSSATSELNVCSDSIQEDVSNYRNSSTQTSFSFVVPPFILMMIPMMMKKKSSNEQREYVNLQKNIEELYFQISNLNPELSVAIKAFFSLTALTAVAIKALKSYKIMILLSTFILVFLIILLFDLFMSIWNQSCRTFLTGAALSLMAHPNKDQSGKNHRQKVLKESYSILKNLFLF